MEGRERGIEEVQGHFAKLPYLLVGIREPGEALVGFDAYQQHAAVGVDHAVEEARDLPGEVLGPFRLSAALLLFVGADELEELTPLFLQERFKLTSEHL